MKTPAFFVASLLAGVVLMPFTGVAQDGAVVEEVVETTETAVSQETDEAAEAAASEDEPAQTIDLSGLQETDLPDAPSELTDAELLQGGDWPAPTEDLGPPKKGTADQLRQTTRIRQLRTVAQRDPLIRNEKARAAAARTPEGRRTLLRNYYVLVHNRMVQLDPSLKEVLEADLLVKLGRLEQRKIRPSVLIEPYQPLPGSRVAERAPVATVTTVTETVTETTTVTE